MEGQGGRREPVVIIGMACQFPGARDPAGLHDAAVAGRRMFQLVAGLPGHRVAAALLDEWTIPAVSFGDPELGPQDLGPVQKLATEITALALADAGLPEVAPRTGLIIASVAPGVSELVRAEFGFTPGARYPWAAYHSSLHAVVAAADALQAGEFDLAVAGGVELGIDPVWLALQARAGTLGTDEMRVYAADSAGLLPGEGGGIVVLARAADARAAGVPVYAEIAGWNTWPALASAVTSPASPAYRRAGIDPADVQFIEGQGAGTSTGDSAELAALTQLRHGGNAVAALSAVSAGIGYARAASGVASLIRTVSAMAAGTIPPGTGCARPHPLLDSGRALLRMPARPEPWPDGTRLAAVNSLGTADPAVKPGFPGAQHAEGVHLVLRREGDTARGSGGRLRAAGQPGTLVRGEVRSARDAAGQAIVFALCGEDPGTLAGRLDDIAASAGALSDAGLVDLAWRQATGARRAADHGAPLRVSLAAATPSRLAAQAQYAAGRLRAGETTRGASEPGAHVTAQAAGAVVVLFPGRAESAAAHPALLTASLEALGTLDRLGVRPVTGVGYGLGEITGLVWAGSLPVAEAARLVAQYARVIRACGGGLPGSVAMARIRADTDLTRMLCASGRLHIAAYEGPRVHVLAGSATAIRELARRAGPLGVPVEVLDGATAMHSPAMVRCVAPLRGIVAATQLSPPRRRLISTITGQLVGAEQDIAELLARQPSQPVLFAQAMTRAAQGADLIVAAGPDAGLAATAAACCGLPAVTIRATLSDVPAETIATLFAAGVINDLRPFLTPAGRGGPLVRRAIPRMRLAELADPQAPEPQVQPTLLTPRDRRIEEDNGVAGRRTAIRAARS